MANETARSQRRKERYNELVKMGFTASEARLYRDRSGTRIDAFVLSRQRELNQVEPAELTPKEERQLEAITQVRDRNILTFQQRMFSKPQRTQQFATWSNFRIGFPPTHQAEIERFNTDAGLLPNDKFGYRMFFWTYVEGLSVDEAEREVESRDT